MKFRFPRLQFSLRTLVIGMVIVAALASWQGSRYARYRARVVAKAELQKRGVLFYSPLGKWKPLVSKLRDPESWLYRWDRYWFGEEAVWECPRLHFTHNYWKAQTAGETGNVLTAIEQFPEIQAIEISIWGFDEYPPFDRRILAGIMELPNLRILEVLDPGELDQAWAECLPDKFALTELRWTKTKIPPAVMLQILERSPELSKLTLEHSMIDDRVVELLNKWKPGDPGSTDQYNLEIHFTISAVESARAAQESSLKKLQHDYRLEIHPDPFANPQAEPLPLMKLQHLQTSNLYCWTMDKLEIRDFAQLQGAHFNYCKQSRIVGCPRLTNLKFDYCQELSLEQLAELQSLQLAQCDRTEVRNCPKLASITGHGELKLSQLPALKSLFFNGQTLSLEGVPRLEAVYLTDPTPDQLAAVAALPALRHLTLWFTEKTRSLPPLTLQALASIKTLERLKIDDDTRFSYIPFKAILPELKSLQQLRLLWIESQSTNAAAIFDNFVEGKAELPPALVIFIGEGPLTDPDQVQQAFPRLTYIDQLDLTPIGGMRRPDYFALKSVGDLPALPDLRKALQQQVLDPAIPSAYGAQPTLAPTETGP